MDEVLVQPLLPVTVTVYVFAADKLLAAVPGVEPPLQAYEAAPAGVAVTLIAVVEQFKTVLPVLLVIAAVGGVVFWVIVMEDVLVQPFVPVTVTVYVFAADKLLAAVPGVEPPLQAYEVAPAGVAVTLIAVVEQFKTVLPVLFVIAAVGGVVFWVMVILAVFVQPLPPVTVTI